MPPAQLPLTLIVPLRMAKKVPVRLKYLRVTPQRAGKQMQPCADELKSLLACWRLNGVDAAHCLASAHTLRACSSAASSSSAKSSLQPSVNFVLNKMFAAR